MAHMIGIGAKITPAREFTSEQRLFLSLERESRRGDSWAPSSPDLNPLDFFLWGYLKERVYKPLPSNLEDLKTKIKRDMMDLPEELVKRSVYSRKKRALKIVAEEGGAFEGKHMMI